MAGYASVISLKHTINGLLNHPRISLVSSTREILESAYTEATSLQQVLERSNDRIRSKSSWERLDALEGEIRDCANKLEDVLEFHELNSQDEEAIGQEISSFGKTVKKMEKAYVEELSGDDGGDGDDNSAIVSSNIDSVVEMVMSDGHSTLFNNIRRHLLTGMRPDDLWFFALVGQVGSGRTLFANTIFEDAREQCFECRAWVTIGRTTKLELRQVLMSIIDQVDNNLAAAAEHYNGLLVPISREEDEKLREHLYKILEHRRYMIVLDDVDDVELVTYLKKSFPDQSNGSIVFLTTTTKEVVELADMRCSCEDTTTSFLYDESMLAVMQRMFFRDEPMSAEFEVAAKKIIHNCRSLPILSAKTMFFLMRTDKTVEQWSKIAADQENPIFMMTDEISEINKIKIELQSYSREVVDIISIWFHFSGEAETVKMRMSPERFFSRMQIISLYGMAGIGKSAFARKVSKDESVLSHFDHHVWITLGPKYQTEEILIDILTQIYPNKLHMNGERDLCVQLSSKRCLIVLDDLCSKEPLLHLKNMFSDIRGTILVTTRLRKVAQFGRDDIAFEMKLLDKEDSWRLLRQEVFAGGSCPPELEKAGRKIAEKCDGLPLLILTVADQLLKVEMSQEYWNNVVSGKEKSVFKNALNQISEALLPSYQSLPQHLKPCFLYMGVFREKYEISPFVLDNLWISGTKFIVPNGRI